MACIWTSSAHLGRRRRAVGKWETRRIFQGGLIAVFSAAADGSKLCRGSVGKRRVWAVVVVIALPEIELPSRIGYLPGDMTRTQMLEVNTHNQRLLEQIPVTETERKAFAGEQLLLPPEYLVWYRPLGCLVITGAYSVLGLSRIWAPLYLRCTPPRSPAG